MSHETEIAHSMMTIIGEPWSKTNLNKAPSLRKDFTQKTMVLIEGIYGWGVGYLSTEAMVSFQIMVHAFCTGNDLQYTPSDVGSGQLSDNKDSYMYFMGMECAFHTTADSEVSAKEWAERFATAIKDIAKSVKVEER